MLTNRRECLCYLGASGLPWLTPLAERLALAAEAQPRGAPAQSLILLWMSGGPSQLETFDPHAGHTIGGPTKAIPTRLPGVEFAQGLEQTAEQLDVACLVRNVVSKEGDHERGAAALKTGRPPETTIVHPSIGAILCQQLPEGQAEIPRHISILADRFPGRGGYLGHAYDAFKTNDPRQKVPDITLRVPRERFERRAAHQGVLEAAFLQGRSNSTTAAAHREQMERAQRMMVSEQLQAFEIERETRTLQAAYGDTPFGRGCLAARRLTEVGVRCVEVTLSGWDTHANNFTGCELQLQSLDAALAALLRDLRERKLLERTVVMCCGEFGRTPKINRLEGRDHWPQGFSVLLAGGRLRRGHVEGATDPEGQPIKLDHGTPLADLHATVLHALGVDPRLELQTPIGRPIRLSDGNPLPQLLQS